MFVYKDGLIGQPLALSKEFLSTGEKRDSLDQKSNIEVTYDLNEYGHRCKSIDQLNDNYILFAGCSFTLGQGVPLENTYPYIVAKHLNVDYYNLGIVGGSVSTTFCNLISFINKVKIKPKNIFIQWPNFERMFLYYNDDLLIPYIPSNIDDSENYYPDKEVYKTLLKHDIPKNQSVFYKNLTLNILSNFNIGIHQVSEHIEFYSREYTDFARDGRHPGIQTHLIWANTIIKLVEKNRYSLITVNNYTFQEDL